MIGVIATIPKYQFSSNGVPMVDGTLETYLAGSTTPEPTYQDQALSTANTTTIVLDARGECVLWLDPTKEYKFILKNKQGVPQWTQDDISGAMSAAVLAQSLGASLIGFTQAETGAAAMTVQAKLRQIAHRDDYNSDAEFNAAKGTRPSIDGSDNFDAPVTPTGGAQALLSAVLAEIKAVQNATHGGRHIITYRGPHSVYLRGGKYIPMSGFRFHGQWSRTSSKTAQLPATMIGSLSNADGSTPNMGAGLTAPTFENWYAVFACANNADSTATLQVMPYIRARTVSGSDVTFNKAGEGVHSAIAQTYAWAVDALAGTECLVISETVDSRANAFSGRVTSITANTTGQMTLASVGAVAAYDWLLPAPPGFDHYRYLGSFYYDTAEVRNIADTGNLVKSYGINLASPSFSASVASPTMANVSGYISPLATAVILRSSSNFATTSVGDYAEYFAMDNGNHTVQQIYEFKEAAATTVVFNDGITVPFSFGQQFYFSNAGGLASLRTEQTISPVGWIEP